MCAHQLLALQFGSGRVGLGSGMRCSFGTGRMICTTYGDVKKIIERWEMCITRLFAARFLCYQQSWVVSL